jgi:Mg2+ and Co2+ transporter CorA
MHSTGSAAFPAFSPAGPKLVWGFEFDAEGRAKEIVWRNHLGFDRDAGFVWLHVDLVHADTRRWLSGLEDALGAACDSLLSPDAHPHIDWRGEMLWGLIRDISREFHQVGEDSVDLRFVVTPKLVLTARRRPVQSAHAAKRKSETGFEYVSSADLFEDMLSEVLDAIEVVSHRTAESLEAVEDSVLSTGVTDERAKLLGLRRELARYIRLATSLRAVATRLDQPRGGVRPPAYCQDLAPRVGQRAASLHADLHLLADHARMLNEEVGAQIAEQSNRNLFTLTTLTTLLLPPSLVTGFFGMNTKNLFFAETEYGTLFALAVAIAAAGGVYLLMRRRSVLD